MRLIDADALAEKFDYEGWIESAIAVEGESTIDAVPVVRCRECSKWDKAFELDNGQVFGACDRFYGAETEDSFFCRDGR